MSNRAAGDRLALAAIEGALDEARATGDDRPAFLVLCEALDGLTGRSGPAIPTLEIVERGRDDWLRRLRSAGRSESAIVAYRQAIGDLIDWARSDAGGASVFEERTIVSYLESYRRRRNPAPATYHRRFLILRRFMRWIAQREGVSDPFVDLDAPPKPRQEADWLTVDEFARLLAAVQTPARRLPGMPERDRLVLLALVMTGLRRAELVALNWGDLDLGTDGASTLLVRCGKGGKPRRQPLPGVLADELQAVYAERRPAADDPVFVGLRGGRLQPAILAGIIRRAAHRAGIEKRVTAHTLRHTAATWLRQSTGDARLVAEYLGHADLSTVSRYTHVAGHELRAGAETIAAAALPTPLPLPPATRADGVATFELAA